MNGKIIQLNSYFDSDKKPTKTIQKFKTVDKVNSKLDKMIEDFKLLNTENTYGKCSGNRVEVDINTMVYGDLTVHTLVLRWIPT